MSDKILDIGNIDINGMGKNTIRISDSEFLKLTRYMQDNYGINLSKKRTLIESRLSNHLMRRGFASYSEYIDHVIKDESGEEVTEVLNFLTTNYSYFMREWTHFEYFKEHVLPEMKPKINDRDLRTWSAGCSSGQEPYTMAMLIQDYMKEHRLRWDAKVLATDISLKALGKARSGIYEEENLENVPSIWKNMYFEKLPGLRYVVKESLKNEVIYRTFNLMERKFLFRRKFHVIFCRNVMIYFDAPTKMQLVQRFYDTIEKGGYLFIGQSESLNREETGFKYVMPSVYQKVD